MPSIGKPSLRLLAATAVSLALAACSSGASVSDKVAETLKAGANVKNVKVTCPSGAATTKGSEFDCTASGADLSVLAGAGTNQATLHVRFDKDNEFTITKLTPANGPNAGANLVGTSSSGAVS